MSSARRSDSGHHEIRPGTAAGLLGSATLACPSCDAPVALDRPAGPAAPLACPFCDTRGPLREFLSLRAPARAARVQLWLRPGR